MNAEVCKNCWWWSPRSEIKLNGECRRHAPTRVEAENSASFSGRSSASVWPVTQRNDWCGDFRHNIVCDPMHPHPATAQPEEEKTKNP